MSFFYCLAELFFSFFFFKFHNEKEICLINISLSLDLFFGEGNQLSISLGRSRWDKKVFFARKFWILKHTVHVWIQPCWDFSWCHSKALNVQWTALKWGNTERAHNTAGYLLISLMATSVSRKTRACTFLTQFCVLLFVFYTVQNGWFLPVLLHVAHRSSVTSNRKFFFVCQLSLQWSTVMFSTFSKHLNFDLRFIKNTLNLGGGCWRCNIASHHQANMWSDF